MTVLIQQDVVQLQVPVNDASAVQEEQADGYFRRVETGGWRRNQSRPGAVQHGPPKIEENKTRQNKTTSTTTHDKRGKTTTSDSTGTRPIERLNHKVGAG